MSENKKTIEKYIEGFNTSNHEQILSCLTDDVEWIIPGAFHLHGKEEFDREIENEGFVGSPTVIISRMVEENDVVIVEGSVKTQKKGGSFLNLVFCSVFEMKNAKVKKLTSYLAEIK